MGRFSSLAVCALVGVLLIPWPAVCGDAPLPVPTLTVPGGDTPEGLVGPGPTVEVPLRACGEDIFAYLYRESIRVVDEGGNVTNATGWAWPKRPGVDCMETLVSVRAPPGTSRFTIWIREHFTGTVASVAFNVTARAPAAEGTFGNLTPTGWVRARAITISAQLSLPPGAVVHFDTIEWSAVRYPTDPPTWLRGGVTLARGEGSTFLVSADILARESADYYVQWRGQASLCCAGTPADALDLVSNIAWFGVDSLAPTAAIDATCNAGAGPSERDRFSFNISGADEGSGILRYNSSLLITAPDGTRTTRTLGGPFRAWLLSSFRNGESIALHEGTTTVQLHLVDQAGNVGESPVCTLTVARPVAPPNGGPPFAPIALGAAAAAALLVVRWRARRRRL